MFISNEIIFVELQKTGCTHIGKLLSNILDGKLHGKHNYPSAELFQQDHIFVGSIRNPWDWYVSLWAYGCGQKGGFYERVTGDYHIPKHLEKKQPWNTLVAYLKKTTKNRELWRSFYADINNVENFRCWLHMLNDAAFRFDFGEEYGFSSICRFAGLMTYRYLKLFCENRNILYSGKEIKNFCSLKEYAERNLYINQFIRNENLEDDLIRILGLCGITLTESQKQYILNAGKTNISSRPQGLECYYDKETAEIVKERERLIIEKFGYEAPLLKGGLR